MGSGSLALSNDADQAGCGSTYCVICDLLQSAPGCSDNMLSHASHASLAFLIPPDTTHSTDSPHVDHSHFHHAHQVHLMLIACFIANLLCARPTKANLIHVEHPGTLNHLCSFSLCSAVEISAHIHHIRCGHWPVGALWSRKDLVQPKVPPTSQHPDAGSQMDGSRAGWLAYWLTGLSESILRSLQKLGRAWQAVEGG